MPGRLPFQLVFLCLHFVSPTFLDSLLPDFLIPRRHLEMLSVPETCGQATEPSTQMITWIALDQGGPSSANPSRKPRRTYVTFPDCRGSWVRREAQGYEVRGF